ncbi:hypothetical protein JB92DRAFT_3109277 [Gautieria morchelliformis]|nr:hypothetical protein JB92DRAFT_3109277 [Gautieria morchelliformis]
MSTPPPVSRAASTTNLSIAACNADADGVTRATAQDVYDQMYVVRVRDGDTRERVDAALATIYEANAGAVRPSSHEPHLHLHTPSYENPLLTASSRELISDIYHAVHQWTELDCPTPTTVARRVLRGVGGTGLARLGSALGLGRVLSALGCAHSATEKPPHPDADQPWFPVLRVWSEVGDICEADCFGLHSGRVGSSHLPHNHAHTCAHSDTHVNGGACACASESSLETASHSHPYPQSSSYPYPHPHRTYSGASDSSLYPQAHPQTSHSHPLTSPLSTFPPHPASHPYPQPHPHSYPHANRSHWGASDVSLVQPFTSSPSLPIPGTRLLVPSPLHFSMRVLSRLEFGAGSGEDGEYHGRVVRHRDFWGEILVVFRFSLAFHSHFRCLSKV